MAFVVADRVKETTSTTGTGTLTLAGATTGFQPFSSGIGATNSTYYTISSSAGSDWEVGIGTVGAGGTTLSRDSVLASSNAGSLVNLSAGVKDIYVTYPSGKSVMTDVSQTLTNKTISGASNTLSNIANASLTNSTISGVSLGSNLGTLTRGTYLTGSNYNGSTGQTWAVDATSVNTASKVVVRDGSGNFAAGTITAALSGNATTATNITGYSGTYWTSNNDGTGSGLDADLLDGQQGTYYYPASNPNGYTTNVGDITGVTAGSYLTGGGTSGTVTLNVDATTTATASKVVARDGNGYVFATYYNSAGTFSTTGAASGMGRFTGTNGSDTYGRSYTAAAARTLLNVADGATAYSANQALDTTSSPSFAGVNINGNLNAVDNIYLAGSLYHEGDTDTRLLFGTNTVTIQTGGSSEITVNTTGVRLGDSGNGYFQPVSGNYGSVQIDGGAHTGYEGYSIGGRAVFMHNNSTTTGIYNDVENEWLINCVHNAAVSLYYNGTSRLQTTNTGANVTGTMNATAFTGDGSGLTNLPGVSKSYVQAMSIVNGL